MTPTPNVTVNWIPNLPRIPYRRGVGQWEGVVMHQTANTNDTATSERAYEVAHWQDAFVHEFIDPGEIVQVANPNYIAYGAGAKANPRFIHLELCSAQTKAEFERSYDAWCYRAAYYLSARQLGVTVAKADGSGTLWAHADVTRYLGGTTHTDPIAYLAKWGKTWSDVVARVQQRYDVLIGGEYMLKADDANKVIAFLSAAYEATNSKEAQDEFHRLADELRKASGQPTA